jgi:cellulose synthase/poly-beta-1,6-N-acetylglucosamine synthase-like glycosyltransferase
MRAADGKLVLLLPYGVSLWLSSALYAVSLPILTLYALRAYAFSFMSLRRQPLRSGGSTEHGDPMVSLLLPLYNEETVVERLMDCCTSFTNDDYEIIVIDDSTDSTAKRLEKYRKDPRVKIIHRSSRHGWKGGALNEGFKHLNPRSRYCLMLDADSVPPLDLIDRYLAEMERTGADLIQGSVVTDLNAGESWVSSSSDLINGFGIVELQAKSSAGLPIAVNGSNFMAKTDLLREYPFEEDIVEDWNLTLRLWSSGKRLVYEPSLVVRSESPAKLKAALNQSSRWAEGMTRNTTRMARMIAASRNLTLGQKVDLLISGMSYVTSIMILLVMIGGLIMPAPLFAFPPTPFLFWASIITTMWFPAGPLSMIASARERGVHLKPETLILGLLEGYLILPFTAYSVIKGLVAEQGTFARTAKSGWSPARAVSLARSARAPR